LPGAGTEGMPLRFPRTPNPKNLTFARAL
jgi:hypothetical protein